jgi:hypothetical protein
MKQDNYIFRPESVLAMMAEEDEIVSCSINGQCAAACAACAACIVVVCVHAIPGPL